MNGPYRPREACDYEGLLAQERGVLLSVATLLRVVGVVGLLAAVAGVWSWSRGDHLGLLVAVGPAFVAGPTLYVGAVLSRLRGGSCDYRSIERAIAGLRLAYAVKALAVLVLLAVVPGLVALLVGLVIVAALAQLLVFLIAGPGSLLVFAIGLWLLWYRSMKNAPSTANS